MNTPKLAIVVSHPIQHFCPQYSSWARSGTVDLKVFFASRHGLDAYHDKDFDAEVQWKGLRLDFAHDFLPGARERKPSVDVDCIELAAALSDYVPDMVLVYGYIQPLQRRAMRWAKANGKPLLLIGDSELRQRRSWLKSMVKRFWLSRLFSDIDVFLTVGDANEAYYRYYGVPDHKLIRTSFPIDRELYSRAFDDRAWQRARVRGLLGIPDDHLVVLMVGKLVPWKRQLDLVAACNRLRTTTSKITVVLAGTGSESSKLQALAQFEGPGGVVFAGFVSPQELVHYYAAADVYAHCSSKEPHSLAISEAIYMGLPVVVSDRCGSYGPSDDVRVGLNGYVYPCGDVDALAGLLRRLATDSMVRQRFGEESRQLGLVHQEFAHGKALSQLVNILNKGNDL